MRPIIGLTSTLVKLSELSEGVYVHQDYYRGIEKCGGLPLVLPLTEPELFQRYLDFCDGVIFTGGEDVDPQHYGAEPHPQLGPILPHRDRVEVEAARYVHQLDKPLLAICRGAQVLNVALGGTLYQDLPSELPHALQHLQKAARGVDSHFIHVEPNSRLHRVFGHDKVRVNSFHHQAVRDLAPGLVVSAKASDGVIEAIEDPNSTYTLGVQWHPESMWDSDDNMLKLFQDFVDQCRR
ncbi:gamma-glutamyl-gamma-aminobutyrate hydrolase family protein [Tumebacillus permanentifrigoris]|uniref:Putative glutamine amidotransferase n=1 Tax=Tumebacillus permanentifrigoris TaxID=378543 RepID=A0A316E0S7_9BACL|nr:gamma-glutamyl-gamma-aminobutyrate hydrolase family protein [Tumebacillus permanentifrigoris]PWK16420.1 putative glutamine amidotransferase [Tumebacillus permanentifrigoris]